MGKDHKYIIQVREDFASESKKYQLYQMWLRSEKRWTANNFILLFPDISRATIDPYICGWKLGRGVPLTREEYRFGCKKIHAPRIGSKFSQELKDRLSNMAKERWSHPEIRARYIEAFNRPEVKTRLNAMWDDPKIKSKHRQALKNAWSRPEVKAGRSGPNHQNWKGGISTAPYCFNWDTIRKFVYERDGNRCILCGSTDRKLHAHHINFIKENCPPENAATLCPNCHSKTNHLKGDRIRIVSMEIFYPMLSELYNYQYSREWRPLESKISFPSEVKRKRLAKKYYGRFIKALKQIYL